MQTVSFQVEFLNPDTGLPIFHLHNICVYESHHSPVFKNRCREKIKEFVNLNYGKISFGYTHYVKSFDTVIGRIPMLETKVKVTTLKKVKRLIA